MTLSLEALDYSPQLQNSIHLVRRVIPGIGFGVCASEFGDRALATWVQANGVTVVAHDGDELNLLQSSGIRPNQMVFRCGASTEGIRGAVNLGVVRFIVGTESQVTRLAECAQRTKYVYLESDTLAGLCDRRVHVVGLHSDVDHSGGADEWASAAERLMCRTAQLKTYGSSVHRIVLSGGSTEAWVNFSVPYLTSVVQAVDEALRQGCDRWNLPRPAVTLMHGNVLISDIE